MAITKIIRASVLSAIACCATSVYADGTIGNWAPSWKSYTQTGNPADIVSSPTVAAAIGRKVDAISGFLQSPSVNGRIMDGTLLQSSDVRAPNGVAGVDSSKNIQTAPVRKSIFIGSARTADMILLEKNADVLINSGRVGLYGHWNGIDGLSDADLKALGTYWAPTESGFGGIGNFQTEGEFGTWSDFSDGTIQAKFGGQFPQEVNTNLYDAGAGLDSNTYVDPANGKTYGCYSTAADLQTVKASVDAMFAAGAKNYAVVSSPNCGSVDFDQPFATGDFWANTRAMALYGGGITMDTAPALFFNHQNSSSNGDTDISTKYTDMVAQMIRWGNQQGLRTTVILPTNANNPGQSQFDPNYINAAMTEVDYLRANDAIPSEFAVEQYGTTDNGSNAPWGDYVPDSMNRLARYLLSVKTPDGGSTAPQASGGLPGNQLMIVNVPYTPEKQIPDGMGSMGQQSTDNVHIHAGAIGDSYSNSSVISVTLMPGSSFLSQIPLTFQGGGSYGNPSIEGANDNWLHLTNHFSTDPTKVGMAFGTDAAAPIIARDTAGNVSVTTGFDFSGGTVYKPLTFYSSVTGTTAHPSLAGGTADHFLHLMDGFTTDSTLIGLLFNTTDETQSFGGIVGLASGTGIGLQGTIIDMQGITHLKNMSKANILAQTVTWEGMMVSDTDDHVPVVYENGNWYPLQLGAALQ